jgi:uncharacterized protein (DUF983 family)
MSGARLYPPQDPVRTGLRARCPRCGDGRLFVGWLKVAPSCPVCGLDLSWADSADGPAVFVILIVGFIIAGSALLVEVAYEPPIWVHIVLWGPLIIALSLGLMRVIKGVFIALQYVQTKRGADLGGHP